MSEATGFGTPYGPPAPASVPAGPKPKRPVRVWDLVLTLILALPMILTVALTTVFSPFLVMASDPCGALECNTSAMTVGVALAFFGPIVVFLLAAIGMILLLVFRRIAFYMPLVGIALMAGVFMIGVLIVVGSVPGASL